MMYVFLLAVVLIFVGELADKSQILALSLATRYKAWQVLVGIFVATLLVHMASVFVGQIAGELIPPVAMALISGVLFVGFGVWTLRGDEVDESEGDRWRRFGPVVATGVAFFLAELGDKTQLMTITIAADPGHALIAYADQAGLAVPAWLVTAGAGADGLTPVAAFWTVTLGSTLGMVLADALAILVGRAMGRSLPEHILRRFSGAAFIVFGIVTAIAGVTAR